MLLRFLKTAAVFSMALYFFIVAYDNTIDFNTNFVFVKHVLSMDTTLKSPPLLARAITDESIQRLLYESLIAIEFFIAAFCLTSSLILLRCLNQKILFTKFKSFALAALFCGFLYFFVGFIIVAGEWFCMWQSHTANAQFTAALFALLMMAILLFLNQEERE